MSEGRDERQRQNAFNRSGLLTGVRLVSLLTLASRVLGLIRDVGMATLFGNGAVLDAFTVAFRLPNLARRLFGEGALATALIPTFLSELEQAGRKRAWQVASCVVWLLTLFLTAAVLAGELLLRLAALFFPSPETQLLLTLTAILLPYVVLICAAAQLSAVLQALGHFTWPALLPVILNVGWIAAIWGLLPFFPEQTTRIQVLAWVILALGVVQLAALWPVLRRFGFRFGFQWSHTKKATVEILTAVAPILLGLSITQLNVLCDSLIAWGFAAPETASSAKAIEQWPLLSGTASSLYFGQRLYQFPLGVFGVALGTVLFPLLSRHAARGRLDQLRADLEFGLELVVVVALPASVGLVLLAQPITTLLFQYGLFDAQDARQTAAMVAAYGSGVWAYCGLLIAHRGLYALGDRLTPAKIGVAILVVNLVANLVLIWPLGGVALALTTAACSAGQLAVVLWCLNERVGGLNWRRLSRTVVRAAGATGTMAMTCWLLALWLPNGGFLARLTRVLVPVGGSVATYAIAAHVLGLPHLKRLFQPEQDRQDD